MSFFNKFRKGKGVTLIEIVMVISIIGIISALLAPVILVGMDSWSYIKNRSELINNGRLAMNRMVREIREAKEINNWEDDRIEFIDINGNTIEFSQEGTLLLRNGDTLAVNLEENNGLSLNYWNSGGNTAVSADEIVRVEIILSLENRAGEFDVKNQVFIRNLQ